MKTKSANKVNTNVEKFRRNIPMYVYICITFYDKWFSVQAPFI